MTKERSLIERLRYDVGSRPGGICEEAAREIERLRRALGSIMARTDPPDLDYYDAYEALEPPLPALNTNVDSPQHGADEPIMTPAKLDAMATLGDPREGLTDEPTPQRSMCDICYKQPWAVKAVVCGIETLVCADCATVKSGESR